jgi:uncharacterized membrane protein (UPF0127 family)
MWPFLFEKRSRPSNQYFYAACYTNAYDSHKRCIMLSRARAVSPAILITGIVLIVLASAGALLINNAQPTTSLYLGSSVFDATVAYTQSARETGYSGVSSIPTNQALILAFPTNDMWQITMKDMKVPIDIVWLNSDKKVVSLTRDASPDGRAGTVFKPTALSRYVVELPAGTISAKTITVGLSAIFDISLDKVE